MSYVIDIESGQGDHAAPHVGESFFLYHHCPIYKKY